MIENIRIGVLGLGYVGLPLSVELSKKFEVIGYDTKKERITELKQNKDSTLELNSSELELSNIKFSDELEHIKHCNFYIVTVPTPINDKKEPDLNPIISATESLGSILQHGDTVVYESTVYPGATEEICVPILENFSNMKLNKDFFVGYSPERINPGDKKHTLTKIVKITSGSSDYALDLIDQVYSSVIKAGTYRASSIKVAEAAKVIENTQRDINIALMNELSHIFNRLDLDTEEVLKAAETKWNFLPFRPGLVGGHCIGVDPYYLTHKAEAEGYFPKVILSGRELNDQMAKSIAENVILNMNLKKIKVQGSKILIMGVTFKENCPDIRNSKVFDLIDALKDFGIHVECYDPWIDESMIENKDYLIKENLDINTYDGVIIAVAHDQFKEQSIESIKSLCRPNHTIFDLKHIFDKEYSDFRL